VIRQTMIDTYRTLCDELAQELVNEYGYCTEWEKGLPLCESNVSELLTRARAALAQPEPVAPTDEEIMELMPETMRDEFSYAAKVCSDATGGQVKPGIFRVCLNHAALEYARAVLARWGTPTNTINQED
jgi:hypothetical protein